MPPSPPFRRGRHSKQSPPLISCHSRCSEEQSRSPEQEIRGGPVTSPVDPCCSEGGSGSRGNRREGSSQSLPEGTGENREGRHRSTVKIQLVISISFSLVVIESNRIDSNLDRILH